MHLRFDHIEFDALLGAGLVAAVHAGLLLQTWSLDWMYYFAWGVGHSSLTVAWLVLLAGSLGLAVPFAGVFERLNYRVVTRLLRVRERNDSYGRLLGPLLSISVLGTALAGIGLAGGLVIGVVGYGLFLPLWLTVGFGRQVPLPLLHIVAVAAWGVFGAILGLLYGLWTTGSWGPGWE
jgi:formate-dependent nitrite reductase membrane component NrfD